MQLIIGNKNYSSWSLRPWILLSHYGIPFNETLIKLFQPNMKAAMNGLCPAGKVPALIDDSLSFSKKRVHVWDTLAICEYINDTYLAGKGWPSELSEKATARAIANEMHSGFFGVRSELPMNIRRPLEVVANDDLSAEAVKDVERICDIWYQALTQKTNKAAPFLFGDFSIADAMYFPIVSRFNTYGITIPADKKLVVAAYMQAMLSLPAFKKWTDEALLEIEVIDEDER
ncbi:MAG: glutathione S-transferase family protein [Thalassotalea sp.]